MDGKQIGMQTLAMETLGDLNDGLVRHAFAEALRRIQTDLQARRRLDKPRVLRLEICFDPILDSAGYISELDITTDVAAKLPSMKVVTRALVDDTPDQAGEVTADILFRGTVPESPRQGHLSDVAQLDTKESGQ